MAIDDKLTWTGTHLPAKDRIADTLDTVQNLRAAYLERLDKAAVMLADALNERYTVPFYAERHGTMGTLEVCFPAQNALDRRHLVLFAKDHDLATARVSVRGDTYRLIAEGKHILINASRTRNPSAHGEKAERLHILAAHPAMPAVLTALLDTYYALPRRP